MTRDWTALLIVLRKQEKTRCQSVSIKRATASTAGSTSGATASTAGSITKAIASTAGSTSGAIGSIVVSIGTASASINVTTDAPIASGGVASAYARLLLRFAEAPHAGASLLAYSDSALSMSSQRRVS